MPKPFLRRLALTLFLLLCAVGALAARAIVEGQGELAASDAAFDRGDLPSAIEHARRSATAYVPGAPHVALAYERLRAIAVGAEAAGQPTLAFAAWQGIRSAALESRSLRTPKAAELAQANQNLSRLEALTHGTEGEERTKQQKQALRRLTRDDAPSGAALLMLGTGFGLALAGLGFFAWRGLDASGRVVWRRATWGLVLLVIGTACWTLAVLRA